MKQTLLEIVQDILSSLDSDEVNSIDDTEESLAVAKVVRDSYLAIVSTSNLPEHWSPFELNATSTATPTIMTLPDDVQEFHWIKYNKQESGSDPINYEEIDYLEWHYFEKMMYDLNTNDTNVDTATYTIGSDTIDILFENDRFPRYYTTFDDRTIIFDAYNSEVDANLQRNKTVCFGRKEPTSFVFEDDFVPDLDSNQFNLLINEARSQAWLELKQTSNLKAENRARRGWIRSQGNKDRVINVNPLSKTPDYGWKRR